MPTHAASQARRDIARAYQIATEWGSYMDAFDRGACFYGFHSRDGRPVSEAHRTQCLEWVAVLLRQEKNHLHATRNNPRRQREAEEARGSIRDLKWMRDWLERAPLWQAAEIAA